MVTEAPDVPRFLEQVKSHFGDHENTLVLLQANYKRFERCTLPENARGSAGEHHWDADASAENMMMPRHGGVLK